MIRHVASRGNVRPPLSLSFRGTAKSTADATSYTFSSFSLGAAHTFRHMFVTLCMGDGVTPTSANITMGGQSMTRIVQARYNDVGCGTWGIKYPTGTTANIVVTTATAYMNASIHVYRVLGLQSLTPIDTTVDYDAAEANVNGDVNTLNPCVVFAAGCNDHTSSNINISGMGALTVNYNNRSGNEVGHCAASKLITAVNTPLAFYMYNPVYTQDLCISACSLQ